MSAKLEEKYLRVYCPAHKVSFTVFETGRIVCESGGEALAHNYPHEDFWEYCCDCQSLWPSELAKGGKAEASCPVCDREATRRFVCDQCKVISVESDEATRRKAFAITPSGAIEPACPGCAKRVSQSLLVHECDEAATEFYTPLPICPFCEEQIAAPPPAVVASTGSGESNWRQAETISDEDDAAKTADLKELKTLCPLCATPRKAADAFCKECGYNFNQEKPADDELTQLRPREEHAGHTPLPEGEHPLSNKRLGLILSLVGLFALALLVVAIAKLSSKPDSSVTSRLEKAIERGNLLSPPGESAYDLYHQLKREGASANSLARFDERLLPLLTARPQQMLSNLAATEANINPPASEWEEAAKLFRWSSEIKPADKSLAARAEYCAGRVAFANKDKEGALNYWKRAKELDRSWAMPCHHMGLIYVEREEFDKARPLLSEAIKREPDWAIPYNLMGTSYYHVQDYDQAILYYNQAVERAPRWARPHAWLGDIAEKRGDDNKAIEEYEIVLSLATPENSSINLDTIRQRLEKARARVNSY